MICQALAKLGITLQWEATRLLNPDNGEELFGAGIQYGLLFRDAAQTIPSNGKVALINLSWDGGNTVYTGRGACPILIQVMNINCSSPACVGLIGYMPVIQVDKEIKGYAAAKQHVTQASVPIYACSLTCVILITLTFHRLVLDISWNKLKRSPVTDSSVPSITTKCCYFHVLELWPWTPWNDISILD